MPLCVEGFTWMDWVVDKIVSKHGVDPQEVEEPFFNQPLRTRRVSEGKHLLFGRSDAGRYLFIVFAWGGHNVRVISA